MLSRPPTYLLSVASASQEAFSAVAISELKNSQPSDAILKTNEKGFWGIILNPSNPREYILAPTQEYKLRSFLTTINNALGDKTGIFICLAYTKYLNRSPDLVEKFTQWGAGKAFLKGVQLNYGNYAIYQHLGAEMPILVVSVARA